MTPEAVVALRELGVRPGEHRARAVTPELIARAERVFCMTGALRQAVCALAPDAVAKIVCLDPDGDLPDPIGQAMPVYTQCAGRIRELVRQRFAALDGAVYSGSGSA
jgi:protein-tyrosine-phosphatase